MNISRIAKLEKQLIGNSSIEFVAPPPVFPDVLQPSEEIVREAEAEAEAYCVRPGMQYLVAGFVSFKRTRGGSLSRIVCDGPPMPGSGVS